MYDFECLKCGKVYVYRGHYLAHIKNNKNCIPLKVKENSTTQKENKFCCEFCGKNYSRKDALKRHINTSCDIQKDNINKTNSKLCKNSTSSKTMKTSLRQTRQIQDNSIQEVVKLSKKPHHTIQCNYCMKFFARNDSLNRHIDKYCKIKKRQDEQKEEIMEKLLEEMKSLKEQNIEIIKKNEKLENEIKNIKSVKKVRNVNNGTINNKTNFNTVNTINNSIEIKLLAFGNEDLSYINDIRYKNIINKGYQSIQEFVRNIHFNKNKPQNHNVYISNMRDGCAMVYDGDRWELRDRTVVLDDMFESKKVILEEKFDEILTELPEHAIRKFSRFLNDAQDDKITANIKKDIKFILYNNKGIPENTKRLLCNDIFIEQEKLKLIKKN